jgi:2-isopropylmalate synthase
LTHVARTVAEIANMAPDDRQAYVGKSAFAHKGGIHVAAMRRHVDSYQHVDPEVVGNSMRVLVSDLSGRGNLLSKAEEFHLDVGGEEARQVVEEIKTLEHRGYAFEGAEASVAIMLHRAKPEYSPPFRLVDFTVISRSGRNAGDDASAEATIKLEVDGETVHTAAEGNGPVNALDKALRKALLPAYPHLADFQLADYKVRILDGDNGTGATTRVLIDTQNTHERWSTVGASANIIEASWRALVDSVEYGLLLAS